jgi:predicted PurR-regulated permease PerM
MNENSKLQIWFFAALIVCAIALNFFIFLPYLSVLVLALVLGIVFRPLHKHILVWLGNRETLAAFLTLIIILSIVLTPLFIIGVQIYSEAHDLYATLSSSGGGVHLLNTVQTAFENFLSIFIPRGISLPDLTHIDLNQHVKDAVGWSLANINTLFSGAAKIVFNLFLLVLALYYVIRDGSTLKKQIIEFSPLVDMYDEQIFKRLERAVNSVVRGSLIVGMLQGILTGIGFSIFGVPNPALWGTVAAVSALIPAVGTSIILIPGIAFLFFSGQGPMALGLVIWGAIGVGLIDNFLGPRLMERSIHIHPFFVLISVLGGIGAFGPIGFLLGPIILSLLFALLDIYPHILKGIR